MMPLVALSVARFELTRLLRYDPRFTEIDVLRILPVRQSFVGMPRPHRVEVERFARIGHRPFGSSVSVRRASAPFA